jgi:hypothetical protein
MLVANSLRREQACSRQNAHGDNVDGDINTCDGLSVKQSFEMEWCAPTIQGSQPGLQLAPLRPVH